MAKISKKDNLAQVVEKYPSTEKVFLEEFGLFCPGCPAAGFESIEEGARAHGFSDKKLERLIARLNQAISKKS